MRFATIFCPVGRKKNDLFVWNAKQICSFRTMNYFAACIKKKIRRTTSKLHQNYYILSIMYEKANYTKNYLQIRINL